MKALRITVLALLMSASSVVYAQVSEPASTPESPSDIAVEAEDVPSDAEDAPSDAEDAPSDAEDVASDANPAPATTELEPEPETTVKPEPAPEPAPTEPPKAETDPAAQTQVAAQKSDDSDSKPTINFDARLRPRLVLRDNHGFGLEPDDRVYRRGDNSDLGTLQARLSAKLNYDALSGEIMLQYAGRNGLFGGNQLTDPNMGVHVAYAQWQVNAPIAIQMGRFEMAYGAQRLIGPVGYHQVGRSFDGARVLTKPTSKLSIDVFGTKYNDELLPEADVFDGDAFFTGAYATFKDTWGQAEVYALYDMQLRADGDGLQRGLATFGARAKGQISFVDLEVEGAFQPGTMCVQDMDGCTNTDMDIAAWFFDSELGFALHKPNRLRAFVGFGMASGDDPDTTDTFEGFNHLYPTAHKWLGRMDIIGIRTNVQEIRAGLNWQAWIAHGTLAYHDFTRLTPDAVRVGGEIDLTIWFKIIEGLKCEVAYGIFLPDEGVSNTNTDPDGVAQWTSLTAVATF